MVFDTVRTPTIPWRTDSWCPPLQKNARMGQPQVVVIHGAEAQGGPETRHGYLMSRRKPLPQRTLGASQRTQVGKSFERQTIRYPHRNHQARSEIGKKFPCVLCETPVTPVVKRAAPQSRNHRDQAQRANRLRSLNYPRAGCNTRNVLPPCDQTSTSASCPFGTLDSTCAASLADFAG
jgi:hypothetical protein